MNVHPLEAYLAAQKPPVGKVDFARRIGISPSALSRLFTGKRRHVGAQACLRIAEATGGVITVEQLLKWRPSRPLKDGRTKSARRAKSSALAQVAGS